MSEPEERHGVPPPYALAMVICDWIWRDPYTGKRTIIGTFSVIGARKFPAVHPILSIYTAFTDGRGKVPIKLRIVDVDEESEPLFEVEQEIDIPDPRAIGEFDAHAMGISFPSPGEYRVQLFACNEMIIERRILVHQIPEVQDEHREET